MLTTIFVLFLKNCQKHLQLMDGKTLSKHCLDRKPFSTQVGNTMQSTAPTKQY